MTPEQEDGLQELVAPNLHAGLRRYFDQRIPTGDFLAAVLRNDLCDAVGRAAHLGDLHGLILWLYHYTPPACWGSPEKVAAWLKRPTKTTIGNPSPSPNAAPAADASQAPAAAPATITTSEGSAMMSNHTSNALYRRLKEERRDREAAAAAAPAPADNPCVCGDDCPNKEPLDMIAATLSGKEWSTDTLDAIAAFIIAAGYTIEEPEQP